MAYIYQIVNDINEKIYVGKTEFSIEKRFKQHCRDCTKRQCENRPLYRAMNKYGIEHFRIELIEETDQPEEREKYWIQEKNSFKNGYNATKGGDGKAYLDYDALIKAYLEIQNLKEVARLYNCDPNYLSRILKSRGIKVKSGQDIINEKRKIPVSQYDLNGNYIQSYNSLREAAYAVSNGKSLSGASAHIKDVCMGKRKTAYGYLWKFAEERGR